MPYEWTDLSTASCRDGSVPITKLRVWPHRSLPKAGFVSFIGLSAGLAGVPLLLLLGSPVLWMLLPFVVAAQAGIWWALRLSYRSGEVVEELRLWPDRLELARHEPFRPLRIWEVNPHWVCATLHETGGPVPKYLTLSGAGRTVEIGAFLSEEERTELKPEIEEALRRLT